MQKLYSYKEKIKFIIEKWILFIISEFVIILDRLKKIRNVVMFMYQLVVLIDNVWLNILFMGVKYFYDF